MVAYEDRCVGCTDVGLHCVGTSCSNRNVEVHYCDECKSEGINYNIDDTEVCENCAENIVNDFWEQLSLSDKLELLQGAGHLEYTSIN